MHDVINDVNSNAAIDKQTNIVVRIVAEQFHRSCEERTVFVPNDSSAYANCSSRTLCLNTLYRRFSFSRYICRYIDTQDNGQGGWFCKRSCTQRRMSIRPTRACSLRQIILLHYFMPIFRWRSRQNFYNRRVVRNPSLERTLTSQSLITREFDKSGRIRRNRRLRQEGLQSSSCDEPIQVTESL